MSPQVHTPPQYKPTTTPSTTSSQSTSSAQPTLPHPSPTQSIPTPLASSYTAPQPLAPTHALPPSSAYEIRSASRCKLPVAGYQAPAPRPALHTGVYIMLARLSMQETSLLVFTVPRVCMAREDEKEMPRSVVGEGCAADWMFDISRRC